MANQAGNTRATIVPTLRYRNAVQAIDWLCDAFGFERHLVVEDGGGGIAHAQLTFGNGMIMLGSARDGEFDNWQRPMAALEAPVTQSPYVIVNDVDAHHRQARAAGARIMMPPEDQPYGGRLYSCRDLEGHLWNFGSYDPWRDS